MPLTGCKQVVFRFKSNFHSFIFWDRIHMLQIVSLNGHIEICAVIIPVVNTCLSQFSELQPQTVAYYADTAQCHGSTSQHRIQ